jgi:hypothetical protein
VIIDAKLQANNKQSTKQKALYQAAAKDAECTELLRLSRKWIRLAVCVDLARLHPYGDCKYPKELALNKLSTLQAPNKETRPTGMRLGDGLK